MASNQKCCRGGSRSDATCEAPFCEDGGEPDLLTKKPTTGNYTEYDRYLKLLAEAQRYKLRLKAHRGWIGNVPTDRLFALLRREVDELEEAMKRDNHFDMILESADCANYCLGIMIAVMEGKKPDGI